MRIRKTVWIRDNMKQFEYCLPENYRTIADIQFDDAPAGFFLDLRAVLPGILLTAVGVICVKPDVRQLLLSLLFSVAALYPYFCLHEIVHWLVYRIMGIKRIRIGFTRSGAYCSVSDCFLYRHVALAGTAAPLVVFTLLFSAIGIRMIYSGNWLFLLFGALLTLHLFTCRSDVHLLQELKKYKKTNLLILDMGTKQTIYLPK